jgi:hypothetical protein
VQNNTATITSSTLENTKCRERYIWILDGGAEAFANREQKYEIAQLTAKGSAGRRRMVLLSQMIVRLSLLTCTHNPCL